ncbi:MAG: WbqC family protein [Flavobacteriaceae bacterium]|nr:WbqC family protein [Flavobacteriaceae bacterium]
MKAAIVQPYIFPYVGYFQLVNAVDLFVFYDDVHFINRGWIHRNHILVNGTSFLFSIPCAKKSQNKLINEIKVKNSEKHIEKLIHTVKEQYKRAPFYNDVYPMVERTLLLMDKDITISEMAIRSVKEVCDYLGIEKKFVVSSETYFDSRSLSRDERIISICNECGATDYINPIGGQELYCKKFFKDRGIRLNFLESQPFRYKQFKNEFVPNLSIIDVLMFNSIDMTKKILNNYKLL